ncbi:MAG: hypothetical protein ACPG77_09050, partial [Nannocystaceae bacterium]
MDNSTTLARCVSVLRVDLSEGTLRRNEPAYNGKALEGRIATKPANNYFLNALVTEGYCNSRGGVCSSGEYQRNEIVSDQDVSYYWRTFCLDPQTGQAQSGCVCDESSEDSDFGWYGDSCTCPVPGNVAENLVTQIIPFLSYISIPDITTVARVTTEPIRYDETTTATGCSPVEVWVADTLTAEKKACEFVAGNGWNTFDHWFCYFNRAYVVGVVTVEQAPECVIRVFSEVFSPCGNNTNPYAGRYSANEFYRGPDLNLEPQPIQFAPYGCTTTECMCGPNHSGQLCAYGLSAKRRDEDNELSPRVCGEDTQPARGVLGDRSCECFKTQNFELVGDACECGSSFVAQLGESRVCYAHGTCIAPSFTFGSCQFDLDDLEDDPLNEPFSSSTTFNESVSYTVSDRPTSIWDNGAGDMRSVFTIEGQSWLIDDTDQMIFDNVVGNISLCAPRVRFPLNLTYYCTEFTGQRAISNTTIWRLDENFDFSVQYEQCDPSVFQDTDPLKCSTTQFCKEEWVIAGTMTELDVQGSEINEIKTCIAGMVWEPLAGEDLVLQTGFYQNVSVICAVAFQEEANGTDVVEFVQGVVLDCSDP